MREHSDVNIRDVRWDENDVLNTQKSTNPKLIEKKLSAIDAICMQ